MRYKLLIEYEGSRYSGWQIQKDRATVQGKIVQAILDNFPKIRFELQGAGRTDRGVHALGQAAHLEIPHNVEPFKLLLKLNDCLPKDINILEASKAPANFHARNNAVSRSYLYQIAKRRTAFGKSYSWWIKDELSIDKMKETCSILEGTHNFDSFYEQDEKGISTTLKLEPIELIETDTLIVLRFQARYFLWKMVRRLTGVIAEVGRGKMQFDDVRKCLTGNKQKPAELTAPPAGLFLEKVYYEDSQEHYVAEPAIFKAFR